MSGNRAPGSIWLLRKPGFPGSQGCVRTGEADKIVVLYYPTDAGAHAQSLVLSRKDARLLAKRLNQCLDATGLK